MEFIQSLPDFSKWAPEELVARVEEIEDFLFSPTFNNEKEKIQSAVELALIHDLLRSIGDSWDQILPEKREANASLGELMRLERISARAVLYRSLAWKL
jgi:hypothetical protein